MSLATEFAGDFSRSAFQTIDGEPQIVGKYGRITRLENGTFDCWFVGPDLAPLGNRKLTAIRKNCVQEDGFTELTGEAYTQGRGRDFVRRMAALAGVKKKRRVTRAVRESLKRARTVQAGVSR